MSEKRIGHEDGGVDRIRALSNAHRLLANLFNSPLSEGQRTAIAAIDLPDDDFIMSDPCSCEGLREMKEACTAGKAGTSLLNLSNDFNKLFVGPGHLKAAPWSSVYLGRFGLVHGESEFQVREHFRKNGYAVPDDLAEPWDHVAFEEQFIANALSNLADSKEKEIPEETVRWSEATRDMCENHCKAWYPQFAENVIKSDRCGFYRGCAKLLIGVCATTERELRGCAADDGSGKHPSVFEGRGSWGSSSLNGA